MIEIGYKYTPAVTSIWSFAQPGDPHHGFVCGECDAQHQWEGTAVAAHQHVAETGHKVFFTKLVLL